jgi:hypothetical protein
MIQAEKYYHEIGNVQIQKKPVRGKRRPRTGRFINHSMGKCFLAISGDGN